MDRKFSFRKGWSQVRVIDRKSVMIKLMYAMNISSRRQFQARLRGDHEPKVTEYEAIKKIFAKYGIKDPWGDVEEITFNTEEA